jgi:hypothetical protein
MVLLVMPAFHKPKPELGAFGRFAASGILCRHYGCPEKEQYEKQEPFHR